MSYPPSVPPNTRTNTTPLPTNLPSDINTISNALTDIINELGSNPKGGAASLTARLDGELQPTAWTAVTFQNSWVNYGSPYGNVMYRKVGDRVFLRGVMKNGTVGAAAFTLPVGFRPPAQVQHQAAGTVEYVDIATDGVVAPFTGTNAAVVLDGCQFSISP